MQQKKKPQNRITPQMFDVRPVDRAGNLDLEKINQIERVSRIASPARSTAAIQKVKIIPAFYDMYNSTPQEDEIRRFQRFIKKESFSGEMPDTGNLKNISIAHSVGAKQPKNVSRGRLRSKTPANFVREVNVANQRERVDCAQRKKEDKVKKNVARESQQLAALKRIAREKSNREAIILARKRRNAKIQSMKLAAGKFKNVIVDFAGAFLGLISAPFIALASLIKKLFLFIVSLPILIGKSFRALTDTRRKYYGYIDDSIRKRNTFSFFAVATCVFFLVFGAGFFYRSLKIKSLAIENGTIAYASLNEAKDGIKAHDFNGAISKFNDAYDRFDTIQKDINSLGSVIVESSRFVPYLSRLSSGAYLSDAGKNISRIGALATDVMKTLNNVKNPLNSTEEPVSYLKIFQNSDKDLSEIAIQVNDLENNLDKVNLEDIPEAQRSRFVDLKRGLPEINKFVSSFSEEEKILADVLGGNGPRKYLFLFQNNQEMRSTGGFIGTYAILDISDGNVKSFFVDGIFNPDGQLREKIIPPAPIQKISASWSLHDSNWFPDFPMSAEKASWFYEKTGGPTVDGVITMTPTVMQKLLEITGSIEMPEYGVTIDKDNFLESIQSEVEVNYDKDLNQPKKILADLAPKILDRIFNARNFLDITKTMDVLLESLNEKHILIYSKNYDIEKMLSANGWSGEILHTDKDYLSVINTNINGYKTDGVIDETISHKAEIQTDGSIIDTVSITRKHNGGGTPHDWWNKVNADYMRVYVPKGAKLIRASGETNEFDSPPIDYRALGFKKDAQVAMEEDSTTIDADSGTRIYEDSGKTVFANWVYVSPQESVTMTYSYLLPFKLDTNLTVNPADTYSLLTQKQSGSVGSKFSTKIIYPNLYKAIWKYPNENIADFSTGDEKSQGIEMDSDLKTDKFIGVAFEKNNP